jgi:hypothetical protein
VNDPGLLERLPIDMHDDSCDKEIWNECQPLENVLGKPFLDRYKKFA